MSHYVIQPRDTLLFRDGRPFGLSDGEGARSLPFPIPSTTTGLLRTLAGQDAEGRFQPTKLDHIKTLETKGPLMVRLNGDSSADAHVLDWLLPAPSDALLVPDSGQQKNQASSQDDTVFKLVPLRPLELPPGARMNLPPQVKAPVGTPDRIPGKPQAGPAYWYWPALLSWLEKDDMAPNTLLKQLGHSGPQEEARTHVAMEMEKGTAKEGALFQTRGRTFFKRHSKRHDLEAQKHHSTPHEQLGLVVELVDPANPTAPGLSAGPVTLGGERRISFLSPLQTPKEGPLAGCPASIRARILKERGCRLLLATPAHFNHGTQVAQGTPGAFPAWLLQPDTLPPALQPPAPAVLIGACVDRPQTVSGWDFEKSQPKHSRRLAKAGSVYFLHFPKSWSDTTLGTWIDAIWMHNVSDDIGDRKDGFGLALLGVWNPGVFSLSNKKEAQA